MIQKQESGFMVVELVIVMTLSIFFSILILGFALDYASSTTTLNSDSETMVTRQNAGDKLRDQLNRASGLIVQNSIADSNAHVHDSSNPAGPYWQVIHAVPATISLPSAGNFTPVLYGSAPSINSSYNRITNSGQPYYDEFILYLDGSTKQLLLRTLANPSAVGNRMKTTCPPAIATLTCPADTMIADAVSSVAVRYFSRSGNLLDYTSITDPTTGAYIGPDMPTVEVVELTLNLKQKAVVHGAQDTKNTTVIRVAFRNG